MAAVSCRPYICHHYSEQSETEDVTEERGEDTVYEEPLTKTPDTCLVDRLVQTGHGSTSVALLNSRTEMTDIAQFRYRYSQHYQLISTHSLLKQLVYTRQNFSPALIAVDHRAVFFKTAPDRKNSLD